MDSNTNIQTNEYLKHWRWLLVLFVALTAGLRLFHIEFRSLWTDEFRTLYSIRLPLKDLIIERASYGHFPTYFILLKYWSAIFGESEWALRLPSALCVVAAAPLVFLMVRKAWGMPAACWASLFFAIHGRAIWAAQEARPYALAILAAAASLHALTHALDRVDLGRPRPRRIENLWWLIYALWSALGLVTHATYLFIFSGQAIVVTAWICKRRSSPRRDWFATLLILAAFAAVSYCWLALHAAPHVDDAFNEKARGLDLALFRNGFLEVFWGEQRYWAGSVYRYCGIVLALASIALAWGGARMRRSDERDEMRAPVFWLAMAWALSIVCVMGAISAVKQDVVRDPRYYSPGLGGACLLMGLGVSSIRGRRWRWSMGAIAIALLSINAAGWLWNPFEQVREAVRYVAQHRAADEPVLFCKDTNGKLMAEYYRLGVVPEGFSRDEFDRDVLKKKLDAYVGNAPGFWLILYKPEKSPIEDVIREWAGGVDKLKPKYREAKKEQFAKAAVRRWRKE